MRKILLALMAVAVLVPSVALRANAATSTAVFQYQATGGTPLTAKSTGANASVAFGLAAFYVTLANDAKKCDLSSSGMALANNAAIIKKFVGEAGDTTYAVGTLVAPSGGATGAESGTAYFAGFSSAPGLTNSALLNTANTASGALLCGGSGGPGGAGQCGSSTALLCITGSLNSKDTAGITDCSKAGQVAGANGTSTVTSFVYPFAGAICAKGEQTLAECCGDKNLVIIANTLEIQNKKGGGSPDYVSIVTSQGTGGIAQAWIQP